jgi:hypothetical protein
MAGSTLRQDVAAMLQEAERSVGRDDADVRTTCSEVHKRLGELLARFEDEPQETGGTTRQQPAFSSLTPEDGQGAVPDALGGEGKPRRPDPPVDATDPQPPVRDAAAPAHGGCAAVVVRTGAEPVGEAEAAADGRERGAPGTVGAIPADAPVRFVDLQSRLDDPPPPAKERPKLLASQSSDEVERHGALGGNDANSSRRASFASVGGSLSFSDGFGTGPDDYSSAAAVRDRGGSSSSSSGGGGGGGGGGGVPGSGTGNRPRIGSGDQVRSVAADLFEAEDSVQVRPIPRAMAHTTPTRTPSHARTQTNTLRTRACTRTHARAHTAHTHGGALPPSVQVRIAGKTAAYNAQDAEPFSAYTYKYYGHARKVVVCLMLAHLGVYIVTILADKVTCLALPACLPACLHVHLLRRNPTCSSD